MKKQNDPLVQAFRSYFGENIPLPPRHIMVTLVEMKQEGIFDESLRAIKNEWPGIKTRIEEASGVPITPAHPFFYVPLSEMGEEE